MKNLVDVATQKVEQEKQKAEQEKEIATMNLLKLNLMSVEQIAMVLQVSVDYVVAIQQKLNNLPK